MGFTFWRFPGASGDQTTLALTFLPLLDTCTSSGVTGHAVVLLDDALFGFVSCGVSGFLLVGVVGLGGDIGVDGEDGVLVPWQQWLYSASALAALAKCFSGSQLASCIA